MDQGSAIIIAGMMAVASPFVLTVLNRSERRRERIEDFARQDRVAAKVDDVAATAKTATVQITNQLGVIHTLVNSDMTAARQSELDQVRLNLIMLRRLGSLRHEMGQEPVEEDEVAIASAEGRIGELEAILADRLAQMRIIEAEAAGKADTVKGS